MTRLLGGAVLVAALAVGLPLRAETPMTPLRSSAPAKEQFVEPPPTVEPESPADAQSAARPPATEPQTASPERPRRAESRPAGRRTASAGRGGRTARDLNRAELRRIGSGVRSYPVYPASPAYPSSYSGYGFGPRVTSEGY